MAAGIVLYGIEREELVDGEESIRGLGTDVVPLAELPAGSGSPPERLWLIGAILRVASTDTPSALGDPPPDLHWFLRCSSAV